MFETILSGKQIKKLQIIEIICLHLRLQSPLLR